MWGIFHIHIKVVDTFKNMLISAFDENADIGIFVKWTYSNTEIGIWGFWPHCLYPQIMFAGYKKG